MIKELLYKWFGLDSSCPTCEVLRVQLAKSDAERRELLSKLLYKENESEPPKVQEEEMRPIMPQFVPWRVRQQMLEAEDRRKAQLMKEKAKEIAELEKEMGIDTGIQENKTQASS